MVCLEASWNGFGKSWCFFAIKNYNEDVLEWSWGRRETSWERFDAVLERLEGSPASHSRESPGVAAQR